MGFVFQPPTIFVLEVVPAGRTNERFLRRRIMSHNPPSEEKQTLDSAEGKPSESFFFVSF